MNNNIIKQSALAKLQSIINKNYIIYVIWDVKRNSFCRDKTTWSKLGYGVFTCPDKAKKSAEKLTGESYRVIDISITENIIPDLQAVVDLELGDDLVYVKFRQFVEMFIFRNKKLVEKLKEQYYG